MTVFEDKRLEDFSLGEGHIAVPVDIEIMEDVKITLYSIFSDFADVIEEKVKCDMKAAKEYLTDILCPVMKTYGFEPDETLGETLFTFRTEKPLERDGVTVILKTNEEISKYKADTSMWRLEVDDDDPFDVVCAAVRDGHIVSAATANDLYDESEVEINVETAPALRGQGLASACAAGLARYLLTETDSTAVIYKCRESNVASYKTALSAGFRLVGREIPFVFYK